MTITNRQRKQNGYVTLVANASGDGITLNGTTNGANATADETVESMAISELMWSIDSGSSWTVRRGANSVISLFGSGHHDYQSSGIKIERDFAQLTSNVDVQIQGAGQGTVIVKVHKVSGE